MSGIVWLVWAGKYQHEEERGSFLGSVVAPDMWKARFRARQTFGGHVHLIVQSKVSHYVERREKHAEQREKERAEKRTRGVS